MHKKLLIFTPISFQDGMAGSKRIAYLGNSMPNNIVVKNLVLSKDTHSPDDKNRINCSSVLNYFRILKSLKDISNDRCIYHYDYPQFTFSLHIIIAYWLGYRMVFDVVEDYKSIVKLKNKLKWKIKVYSSFYLLKWAKIFGAKYIGISEFIVSMLKNSFSNTAKVLYLPIAIDCKLFEREADPNNSLIQFFYGGSFVVKDEIEIVLEAFKMITYQNVTKKLKLVLSGKATEERIQPVLDYIKRNKLINIEYLGFLSDVDYYECIFNSNVLIMPRNNSSFANTGFPFKLGEYMATGNCTIASKIDSVAKLIEDEDIVYYEPSNIESLVSVMKKVVENHEYRCEKGKKSRRRAYALFSADVHASNLVDFIYNT